jgi:predicted Zn-dependent protease with MMP-like domain
MQRERFTKVIEDVLDSLPKEFRTRIRNVAVLVGDVDERATNVELEVHNLL